MQKEYFNLNGGQEMQKEYFKSWNITPKVVLAGDSVEFTVTLVVGKDFQSQNSRLIFDTPGHLGYTRPSCLGQEDQGYIEVFCSNPNMLYQKSTYNVESSSFGDEIIKNPFIKMAERLFVLDFKGGEAQEGDEIVIKWGYTRDNFGVGTKITALVLKKEFYNSIIVRYFNDGEKGLPEYYRSFDGYERPKPNVELKLPFRVLPREPERLRLIRMVNGAALQVLDRFENICCVENLEDIAKADDTTSQNDYGVIVCANKNLHIISDKLPILETPDVEDVFEGMNIYFGDMHTHSTFSIDCIERERSEITPAESFQYARDVAKLDFMALTDHHQPWDIERRKLGEERWNIILEAADKYNKNDSFVAFPGFEYRCERGDTQVVLNESLGYELVGKADIVNIKALWENFKGSDYISIFHFHNPGRLADGEWYHCPYEGVEPVIEINSCHGSFEGDDVLETKPPMTYSKGFRHDRTGRYFLKKGYKHGFVCNSDGHKGNPGRNGLTAVYAKELTRDAIIDAIRKRHCYGTTNARIKLLFAGNGKLMGSIIQNTETKVLSVKVTGENIIKAVDILKNGELYKRFIPNSIVFEQELIINEAEASNWYVRVTQIDNHIAYSSPIWYENRI